MSPLDLVAGFSSGMEPEALPVAPAADPLVRAMVWGGVLVALIVFPTVVRLWRLFVDSLVRQRSKLPAAERTAAERLSQVAALLLCALMWGLILYCAAFGLRGALMTFTPASGIALTAGAALVALLVQMSGFAVVGYAFSTPVETRSWIRALTATQSMSAYWLMIPAIGSLLFPAASMWLLYAGAAVYVAFRIMLWVKCFTIFYTGPFSIVYFFLYLCTLETVPLLLPVGVAFFIC